MTDNQRVEKRYAKIKEKHPHITDPNEINKLALKLDKKITAGKILGWFAGAIASVLLALFSKATFPDSDSQYYIWICVLMCIFEGFKTLSKFSKCEKLFSSSSNTAYEGPLTKENILEDGKKIFKKEGEDFVILKLPLVDTEETTEDRVMDFVNIHHIFLLHFVHPETNLPLICKVSTDTYMNASIGSEYYVAITPSGTAAAAYQVSARTPDASLMPHMRISVSEMQADETNGEQFPMYTAYDTAPPLKKQKTLPIIALVLVAIGWITPFIISLPAAIAAVVISIISIAKERSKLTIASVIICCIWAVFAIFSLVSVITGQVSIS